MANYPKFTPRTPGTVIADPAEFVALMEDATLNASVGLVWWGATAPDVVTYSELTRSVWVDTSGATVALRSWDAGTSSWITEPILDGSITTGKLATGAVTISKLSGAGGSTGNLLRVSSLGTIVFDDPANLFDASHRLPITSLSLSPVGDYVLTCNGTTQSWATFASKFSAQTVALTAIATTGIADGKVLGQVSSAVGWNYVESYLRDGQTAIAKLTPGTASTVIGTNSGGTAIQQYTMSQLWALLTALPSTAYTTAVANYQAIPAAGNTNTFAHGFAAVPRKFGARIINQTDATYTAGMVLDVATLYRTGGTSCAVVRCDSTNIYVDWGSTDPVNLAGVAIDPTKWKVAAWADNY